MKEWLLMRQATEFWRKFCEQMQEVRKRKQAFKIYNALIAGRLAPFEAQKKLREILS
jgi:hypothetical protein